MQDRPNSAFRIPLSIFVQAVKTALYSGKIGGRLLKTVELIRQDPRPTADTKKKKETASPCLTLRHPSDTFPLLISNPSSFHCAGLWLLAGTWHSQRTGPRHGPNPSGTGQPRLHRLLTCSWEEQWENPLSPFLFLDRTETSPPSTRKNVDPDGT
jgi:hypothetical protein